MSAKETWHRVYAFGDPTGERASVELRSDGSILDVALLHGKKTPVKDGTGCFGTLWWLARQREVV